jgi:ABC-type uncharacterized transport system involved in gliding motility auxiliary subunit
MSEDKKTTPAQDDKVEPAEKQKPESTEETKAPESTEGRKPESAEEKGPEQAEERSSESAEEKGPEQAEEKEEAEQGEEAERSEGEAKQEEAGPTEPSADATASPEDTGRRLKLSINSIAFTALTIIGLILINVVSANVYERADLTEDNLYTLSDSSKKLVKKLPRDLTVKLFVSETLLPGYRETARYIKDLLEEYKTASNGRFKWEVIHPELSDKFKKAAERYGIKPFVARAKSATAMEARTISFGMVISYNKPDGGEEVEVLPRLVPGIERNIEYLITERIKRLSVKRKQILFISGHQEFPGQHRQKIEEFLQKLFNQYTVKIGPISGDKGIPEGTDVVVGITPQTPYSQKELEAIDEFVMKGDKGALFMVDGLVRRQQRRMPNQKIPPIFMAAKHGLNDLLSAWSIEINADVVMDHQLQLFPTSQGVIFHPAIPAIRLKGLKQPVTPFIASSLSVNKAFLGERSEGKPYKILPLLASTQRAWTQKPPFFFNVQKKPRPPEGVKLQGYLLGVLAEGRLPSMGSGEAKEKKEGGPERSASASRVAVIGDSDMLWLSLKSRGNRLFVGNRIFLQNLMDRLAQDVTLIELRNKMAENRDLELPEEPEERRSTIRAVKAINMLGVPLLVVVLGVILWSVRKSRRSNPKL